LLNNASGKKKVMTMNTPIGVVTVSGATFISVGEFRLPLQSFIGDWEGDRWGDGKFTGIASVAAVATLRLGASLAGEEAIKIELTAAADELTRMLSSQITAFTLALKSTPA
jgi:hypothetical protein